jgi:hypothetical protein
MKTGYPLMTLALAGVISTTAVAAEQNVQQELQMLKQQVEALSDQVESQSKASVVSKTTIGGYGEMHYNYLNGDDTDDKKEIDFHRFVLFFGHEFAPNVRFFSELELEHAVSGDGKNGEVELEQAYINFGDSQQGWRVGLFLLPVGFLNSTHEPPTFFGVERNLVERNIIPTTWWEGGVSRYGHINETLRYEVALHSGLALSAADDFAVRAGRQQVSEAAANDLALTANLNWLAMPGVEVGVSGQYQLDADQAAGESVKDARMMEVHGAWRYQQFGAKALYALWDIEGDDVETVGADKQSGWYIEPAYYFNTQWAAFARYEEWDNSANADTNTRNDQSSVGVNYYPHEQVVFKADYQMLDNADGSELNGVNLGVGYQF